MRRSSSLLVVAALAAAPLLAEAPSLDVEVTPKSATVGDPVSVTLTLRLEAAPATSPVFPDWSHGWGDAEIRSAEPPESRTTPAGVEVVQHLTLSAYRPGTIALPPVTVRLAGPPPLELTTPTSLALEIRSVLPEDPQQQTPRPPAAPVALSLPRAFWWAAAALALLVIAAVGLLRRRLRSISATAPILTPEEELDRLLAGVDPRDPEAAHAALSLALRRFLGRKFQMPAAESTTSELQRRLAQRGLPGELVRRIARLLREVDQIKFALEPTTSGAIPERLAEARAISQAVTAHFAPPAPEVAA